jgi:hypothetical protein
MTMDPYAQSHDAGRRETQNKVSGKIFLVKRAV